MIINVAGLVYCAFVFFRSLEPRDGKDPKYRKWMRIMGVIVTVVSAYRAILVWKIPYTFRIPNTFAEVAFAGLFAWAMIRFNKYLPATDGARAKKFMSFLTNTPYFLFGCIVLAQPIDTLGAMSGFALTSVLVETLWGLGFLSVLPLAIVQLFRAFSIKDKEEAERLRILRYSAIIIVTWCVVYVMYRWIFTLPYMWQDAIVEIQTGLPPLGIDINWMRIRTPESFSFFGLIWFSSYFSILTWISIFLMQAPRPMEISGKQKAKLLPLITLSLITIGLIALVTLIGLSGDIDDIIILLVLASVFLVPIAYFFVKEIKRFKLMTAIE
ncbi:MAG: hypothetical protein ACTSSG_00760 [Candidatus Heimdallarchaeaceae archaeon]